MIRSDLRNQRPSDRNCLIPCKLRPQLDIPFPRSFRGLPSGPVSVVMLRSIAMGVPARPSGLAKRFRLRERRNERGRRRRI